MMNETLGKAHFWLFFIGFNLTFMPHALDRPAGHAAPHVHVLGGAEPGRAEPARRRRACSSRRIAILMLLAQHDLQPEARRDGADRIRGTRATLEWATTSPPAEHNFNRIPTVHTREPLWLEREQVEARRAARSSRTCTCRRRRTGRSSPRSASC